jgi:hypothetical protein
LMCAEESSRGQANGPVGDGPRPGTERNDGTNLCMLPCDVLRSNFNVRMLGWADSTAEQWRSAAELAQVAV